MASGAAKRETEERAAERIDLFVDDVEVELFFVVLGQRLGTNHQEPRGNDVLRFLE